MNELRRAKLESVVLHLVSGLVSRKEIKDHRVGTDIGITQVQMSKDGAYADIYVSSFHSADRSVLGAEGLNHAAGFIRRKLAPKLHLRKIPIFRFHADHRFRNALAVGEHLTMSLSGTEEIGKKKEGPETP